MILYDGLWYDMIWYGDATPEGLHVNATPDGSHVNIHGVLAGGHNVNTYGVGGGCHVNKTQHKKTNQKEPKHNRTQGNKMKPKKTK